MNRAKSLFIWLLPAALLFNVNSPSNAWGEGINFHGELKYTNSETEITNKRTGQLATGETSQFNQRYNLDLYKSIYPYLTLSGGTLY